MGQEKPEHYEYRYRRLVHGGLPPCSATGRLAADADYVAHLFTAAIPVLHKESHDGFAHGSLRAFISGDSVTDEIKRETTLVPIARKKPEEDQLTSSGIVPRIGGADSGLQAEDNPYSASSTFLS